MKKLSVFVFISILFLSCKNQKAPDFAVISGKILKPNSDKITLDNLYDYDDFRDISLTKSGEFRDTITLDWNHGYSIYENNNESTSISIDDQKDHAKWKQMIIDEKLGGIQLFADNSWESKFIKDYMIQGIPRFILIDPSGNIVNSNAPRPSNKDLIALFDELNI